MCTLCVMLCFAAYYVVLWELSCVVLCYVVYSVVLFVWLRVYDKVITLHSCATYKNVFHAYGQRHGGK